MLLLGTLAVLPIAMSGTFAGEQLALELAISLAGIVLIFAVLLRFGLLTLVDHDLHVPRHRGVSADLGSLEAVRRRRTPSGVRHYRALGVRLLRLAR